MERVSVSTEKFLYAGLAVTAVLLRLLGLGHAPLSEAEARLSLQALGLARHTSPVLTEQPGLAAFTSLALFLFGSTDAIARLVPAIFGGLLPLLAWPLRTRFGRTAAFLLACALAYDPMLVALSRVANSPIPALVLLLAAFLAALDRRWDYALPLGVLGVLFGVTFWFGLLVLLISGILGWAFLGYRPNLPKVPKKAFVGAFWSLLLVGTLVYWAPEVLGASLNSLAAFLRMGRSEATISVAQGLFVLAAYAPLPLGVGILAAYSALRSPDKARQGREVALWALVAAVASGIAVVIYPARSVASVLWADLALWVLTAWALSDLPRLDLIGLVHGALTFLLFAFILINISGWAFSLPNSTTSDVRLILVGVTFLIIALETGLISWGWGIRPALGGLAWGALVFGLLFNLSVLYRAAYAPRPFELLYGNAASPNVRLLQRTAEDFGNWVHGAPKALQIVDVTNYAAFEWDFHTFRNFVEAPLLSPQARPEAIITPVEAKPPVHVVYKGQDFRVVARLAYPFSNLRTAIQWLIYRKGEVKSASVVFWVRGDLLGGRK